MPFSRVSKCKWQPVELPVVPTWPISCPRLTCPPVTAKDCRWLYVVASDVPRSTPWSMTILLPYPPVADGGLAEITVPAAAAYTGTPQPAA